MAVHSSDRTSITESKEDRHWIGRFGYSALAVAVLLHGMSIAVWTLAYWGMIDLEVYRDGAITMLRGAPLYEGGVTAGLKFVYPPFAAILFTPLALFSLDVLRYLWTFGNIALLAAVIGWCWRRLPTQTRVPFLPAVAFFTGALFFLDAVRVTVYLGQINLVLMALVVWDVVRLHGKKWQGVGIGLAAAVKLTPLLFVAYLLITRRFRAAAIAVGTFAATVAASFVFLPGQATRFWLDGAFGEVSRINPIASSSNHSLRGMIARLWGEGAAATVLWAVSASCVLVVGLLLARKAHAQGNEVLGLALCGLTGAAISPFSWTHHWVWLALFVLSCAHLAITTGSRRLGVFTLLLGASAFAWLTDLPAPDSGLIPPSGLASLDGRLGAAGGFVAGNVYVLTFAVVLLVSAALLRRTAGVRGAEPFLPLLTTPRA